MWVVSNNDTCNLDMREVECYIWTSIYAVLREKVCYYSDKLGSCDNMWTLKQVQLKLAPDKMTSCYSMKGAQTQTFKIIC